MSKWTPEQIEKNNEEMIRKEGAYLRTVDIHEAIESHIETIPLEDPTSHIYWNQFKRFIERFEPSLSDQPIAHNLTDDLPF